MKPRAKPEEGKTIEISKLKKLSQKEFDKVIFAKGDLTITRYGKSLAVIMNYKKFNNYMNILNIIKN